MVQNRQRLRLDLARTCPLSELLNEGQGEGAALGANLGSLLNLKKGQRGETGMRVSVLRWWLRLLVELPRRQFPTENLLWMLKFLGLANYWGRTVVVTCS